MMDLVFEMTTAAQYCLAGCSTWDDKARPRTLCCAHTRKAFTVFRSRTLDVCS